MPVLVSARCNSPRAKLRPVEAKPVSEMTWEGFVVLYREQNLKGVTVNEFIYLQMNDLLDPKILSCPSFRLT